MNTRSSAARFGYVDGLRGAAALAVVLFHCFRGTLVDVLRPVTPLPLAAVFDHGYLGVQVFFVLSGFVIAHSLRDTVVDAKAAGHFVVRRQLRLDPPYWAALAIAIADLAAPVLWHGALPANVPAPGEVVAHLFYAQDLLGMPAIVAVFWTLCLEIQFYLVFIGVLWAQNRLYGTRRPAVRPLPFALLGLLSLGVLVAGVELRGFFLVHWYLFLLGVLAYWAAAGRVANRLPLSLAALALIAGTVLRAPEPFVGVLTGAVLWAAPRLPALARALSSGPLLYLGARSYSLYLIHATVAYRFLNGGLRITGQDPRWAVLWFLLALLGSLVAAHVLHALVERPSIALASRFRDRRLALAERPGAAPAPLVGSLE